MSSGLPTLNPMHQTSTEVLREKYQVSIENVEKKLLAIDIRKSGGPDDIPNWTLRYFAGYFAPSVAAIFHSSFVEGFIPGV